MDGVDNPVQDRPGFSLLCPRIQLRCLEECGDGDHTVRPAGGFQALGLRGPVIDQGLPLGPLRDRLFLLQTFFREGSRFHPALPRVEDQDPLSLFDRAGKGFIFVFHKGDPLLGHVPGFFPGLLDLLVRGEGLVKLVLCQDRLIRVQQAVPGLEGEDPADRLVDPFLFDLPLLSHFDDPVDRSSEPLQRVPVKDCMGGQEDIGTRVDGHAVDIVLRKVLRQGGHLQGIRDHDALKSHLVP